MKPVRGDIVIRTGRNNWQGNAKLGNFCKVNMINEYGLHYGDYIRLEKGDWRRPTVKELEAYNKGGIKNISDIPDIKLDNYSII